MDTLPIARAAYDTLADAYAAQADTRSYNAYYERPATLALLPDVAGLRVVDAGCGPGSYTHWLLERGADVTAFDVSPAMVAHAQQRIGGRARVLQADLAQPLAFLETAGYDLIVSALALDYVYDLSAVFREFARVLRPAGTLVCSVSHPFADARKQSDGNYFEVEYLEQEWSGFGIPVVVPVYRRPLGALLNPLMAAGFILEQLLEPTPTVEFQQSDPEMYAELMRRPGFLCMRARRNERDAGRAR